MDSGDLDELIYRLDIAEAKVEAMEKVIKYSRHIFYCGKNINFQAFELFKEALRDLDSIS